MEARAPPPPAEHAALGWVRITPFPSGITLQSRESPPARLGPVIFLILYRELIILPFHRRTVIKFFHPVILSMVLGAIRTGVFVLGAGALLVVLGLRSLGPAGERAQVAMPSQTGLAIFNTALQTQPQNPANGTQWWKVWCFPVSRIVSCVVPRFSAVFLLSSRKRGLADSAGWRGVSPWFLCYLAGKAR